MLEFFHAHSHDISQIFGFCAMATAISMYQFRRHRTIMVLTAVCSTLWCLHYAFLGELTPILMNLLNVVRGIIYSFRTKPWGNKKCIPYLFSAAAVVMAVCTWKNAWGLLPCVASVFATFANWQTDTKKLKLLTIPVCLGWFVYNMIIESLAGMANETFTLCSIIVALIRMQGKKQTE